MADFVFNIAKGRAADISGYDSAQEMLFTSPSGQTVAKTAAFGTDGTDGVIEYTVDEDFLTAGHWKLRGRVSSATAVLTTVVHSFEVIG